MGSRAGGGAWLLWPRLSENAAAAFRAAAIFSERSGPAWQLMGTAWASGISPREGWEAGHWCLSDSWGLLSLAEEAHSLERSRTHCALEGVEAVWGRQVSDGPTLGS